MIPHLSSLRGGRRSDRVDRAVTIELRKGAAAELLQLDGQHSGVPAQLPSRVEQQPPDRRLLCAVKHISDA